MNVVILHCHFERGGVTQVVENHVRWLSENALVDRILLVSGDRATGLSRRTLNSASRISIPGFDYDSQAHSSDAIEPLFGELEQRCGELEQRCGELEQRCGELMQALAEELKRQGISPDNTVLHWHNHSLGKNTVAPAVIQRLAESGWRILLQIHDFAEDSRPENYRRLVRACGASDKATIDRYLYPVASQIHYATLTRADASVLTQLGVPAAQTHCLPNSVVVSSTALPAQEETLTKVRRAMKLPRSARWCLYPVRGIRRKNVGEFLMLSRWTRPDQYAGLTLRPATPVERNSYERWRSVAAEVAPRAVFDAGHDPDVTFTDNLLAADFIVSTSVAEGFGMAFLEPWLVHREVIARRLPTVTEDFETCDVELSKLYDAIPIPGDVVWIGDCIAESTAAMRAAWSGLPKAFLPSLELGIPSDSDCIDFARLTSRRQTEVLRKLSSDAGFEAAIKHRSAQLVHDLTQPPDETLLRHNADVVNEQYSPQKAGERLIGIYGRLASAAIDREVQSPAHAGIGVDLIAAVRPYFPCRTEVLD